MQRYERDPAPAVAPLLLVSASLLGVAVICVVALGRWARTHGARAEVLAENSYQRYRAEFEAQLRDSILPLLKIKPEQVRDLRIARWGHPLPVAAKGLIADGTVDALRAPFKERVFFVEQDNWALPALETSVTEALTWAPEIKKVITGTLAAAATPEGVKSDAERAASAE